MVVLVVFLRNSAHSHHPEPFGVVGVDARVGVVPEAAGAGEVVGAGGGGPTLVAGAGAVVPEVFAVDAVNFSLISFTDFSNHSFFTSSFLPGEGKGW